MSVDNLSLYKFCFIDRLWWVDILDRINSCACVCAHVSKLSVLLSAEMGVAHYAPGFTKGVSIFLIAIAITNGLLFESKINSTKVSNEDCMHALVTYISKLMNKHSSAIFKSRNIINTISLAPHWTCTVKLSSGVRLFSHVLESVRK